MKKSFVIFCAAAALTVVMIGCGAPADNTNTTASTAPSPAASKAVETKASPATETASADKIGVAECDEFLTKYEACIKDSVPAAMRGTLEQSMAASRNAYRTAAATPQGKASLAAACASALETTKKSMASYNCKW